MGNLDDKVDDEDMVGVHVVRMDGAMVEDFVESVLVGVFVDEANKVVVSIEGDKVGVAVDVSVETVGTGVGDVVGTA